MSEDVLLTEERDGVFIVTLNRPRQCNALNSELWEKLCDAWAYFDGNDALQVAILTNNGKVFCAGADLKEAAAGTFHAPEGRREWGAAGMTRHYWDKPIIVACNGKALGGGAGMLMAADLALISTDGEVGFPEVCRGRFPGADGATLRSAQYLHPKHAAQMLLTGLPIDADTAVAWGIANRAVSPEKLMDEALEMARAIIANGPYAVRLTKKALYECMGGNPLPDSPGWKLMDAYDAEANATEDAIEGAAAFAEKRAPHWQGR